MKRTPAIVLASVFLLISALVPSFLAFAYTKDHTPPKITSLHIGSSESNPSIAVAGDTVTLSVTADEKVTPLVLVDTRKLFVKATNISGNSWDASYTVDPKDPLGTVEYLLTLTDTSGNTYICTSVKLPIQIIPRCLTTDGSSVTIQKFIPPPADTQAPVIAAHADIFASATNASGTVVTYTNPTATDNVDGTDPVTCVPASGTLFAIGTTTVGCTSKDAAGNNATPTSFNVVIADTQAPVIAAHDDITVAGSKSGTAVSYTAPTATDNVDGTDAVSCTPISGSTFAVGTTTVTCTAQDAAGNAAVPTTFNVGVYVPVPMPYTMASQSDDSFLCTPDWENCFTGGSGQASIKLGQGSTLGNGTLLSVTIAKDESSPFVSQPWIIQLQCFTNSAYSTPCPDWVQAKSWNAGHTDLISEFATSTADNKHWTAYFTDISHEANSDGTSPIVFNPNYYYQLNINDNGWNIGAYGTPTSTTPMLPYYVITGMTL